MDHSFTLRPIGPDDEEFLTAVYASTRTKELSVVPWTDAAKDAFLRMQFAAQHCYYQEHYTGAAFQIIVRDGRPIGRLYVARWPAEIRIMDIALLPEHRNAGLGSAILRELLAEGDAAGKPVTIHVERFNPALRLYQRLGFQEVAEVGAYWLMKRPPAPA